MKIIEHTDSKLTIGTENVGQRWYEKAVLSIFSAVVLGGTFGIPLYGLMRSAASMTIACYRDETTQVNCEKQESTVLNARSPKSIYISNVVAVGLRSRKNRQGEVEKTWVVLVDDRNREITVVDSVLGDREKILRQINDFLQSDRSTLIIHADSWFSTLIWSVLLAIIVVIAVVRALFACFQETQLIFDKGDRTFSYRQSLLKSGDLKQRQYSFSDITSIDIEEKIRVSSNAKGKKKEVRTYSVKLLLSVPPHSFTLFSSSQFQQVQKQAMVLREFVGVYESKSF